MTESSLFVITVLGQTIIQRVERREKQREQIRFWDLEKFFNPLSRGVSTAPSSTGCVHIKNGPLFLVMTGFFAKNEQPFFDVFLFLSNLEQSTCNCSSKDGLLLFNERPTTALCSGQRVFALKRTAVLSLQLGTVNLQLLFEGRGHNLELSSRDGYHSRVS